VLLGSLFSVTSLPQTFLVCLMHECWWKLNSLRNYAIQWRFHCLKVLFCIKKLFTRTCLSIVTFAMFLAILVSSAPKPLLLPIRSLLVNPQLRLLKQWKGVFLVDWVPSSLTRVPLLLTSARPVSRSWHSSSLWGGYYFWSWSCYYWGLGYGET